MRRLLLHMGLTKTGTSAIQTWCLLNRVWLQQRGVRYPEHRSDVRALQGVPVPGNGVVLLPVVGMRVRGADDAERALREVATDTSSVTLYSTELMFGQMRPAKLDGVRQRVAQAGVATEAVVYVRDIAAHALSLYAQRVQQTPYRDTVEEYLTGGGASSVRYTPRLRRNLQALVDVLGADRVTVRHFDSRRGELVDDFLTHVLGVDDRDGIRQPPTPAANRSLTLREIEWKRYLNQTVDDPTRARVLGRRLCLLPPPDDGGRLGIPPAGLEQLEQRFSDDVDWVNRHFFAGDPVLSVAGGMSPLAQPEQPLPLSDEERRLLDWLATTQIPQA